MIENGYGRGDIGKMTVSAFFFELSALISRKEREAEEIKKASRKR